jgi:hypothetical protein
MALVALIKNDFELNSIGFFSVERGFLRVSIAPVLVVGFPFLFCGGLFKGLF